jgi:hypothetical protein
VQRVIERKRRPFPSLLLMRGYELALAGTPATAGKARPPSPLPVGNQAPVDSAPEAAAAAPAAAAPVTPVADRPL